MTASFQCITGLIVFVALAWLCSTDRTRFPWRPTLVGIALQFLLAVAILRTRPGRNLFNAFQDAVTGFIGYASRGSAVVFGPLSNQSLLSERFSPENGLVLAITLSSIIILVSTVSSLLYHWGILQKVVRLLAWVMRRGMGTSGSETLAAAANIFIGQTEAPLLVRPYIPGMTRSELLALMIGGMATIAGSVFGVYVGMGIPAGHLLTASLLSAPAGLLISKIMLPETEPSETAAGANASTPSEAINALDAACHGASDGMKLSINVIAMLLAFVSLVALVNGLLSTLVSRLGGTSEQPLQWILGIANAPVAWLMGVSPSDCRTVGTILGERIVLNEFLGYLSLAKQKDSLDPRSTVAAIYALCGFANLGSIAIQIGGIGAMAPSRRHDLARLGWRSLVGGLLACYMTACVAGLVAPAEPVPSR